MAKPGKKAGKRAAAPKRAKAVRKPKAARTEAARPRQKSGAAGAKLKSQLRAARDRQNATADILKVIASSPSDVQPVFQAIAESARRLLGSYTAVVTRVVDGMLQLAAGTSENEAAAHAVQGLLPYPLSSPRIHAKVARTGEVAFNIDAKNSDLPQSVKNFARTVGWRSMLVVPMLRNGVAIGTIGITRREPGSFDQDTIDLLKTFADQAVIAIENARLFNETEEALARQTAVAQILEVINSSPGDLTPVFDAILERATSLCGAGFSALAIHEGDDMHQVVALRGAPPALANMLKGPIHLGRETGLGRLVRGENFVHIADASNDEGYRLGNPVRRALVDVAGARTYLAVPIRKDDVLLGSFTIYRREVRPFSRELIALLQSFAAQAAIAIDNARLFNETREALERQTATADILKIIASSPSDTQPVFDAIVQSGLKLFPSSAVMLVLASDGIARLAAIAQADASLAEMLQQAFPVPLSREYLHAVAIMDSRLVDIPDATSGNDFLDGRRTLLSTDHRAITIIPMMRGDQSIGALSVVRRLPGPLSKRQMELLKTFADQAVIAIENTRLLNETKEALERQTATSEVLQVISSSSGDLAPVFESLLASAKHLCDAEFGIILLREGDAFRTVALHGTTAAYTEARWRAPLLRPAADTGLGRVLETRQAVQIADVRAVAGYVNNPVQAPIVQLAGVRSKLSVPMLKEEDLIGVIEIDRQEVRPFTDKQVELVQNFADQAVIAIENTRLMNETREALEQQTATSQVLEVISSSPGELARVFQTMLEKATRVCEANFGILNLWDGENFTTAASHNVPPAFSALRQATPVFKPHPQGDLQVVVTTRQVMHIHDVRTGSGYLAGAPNVVELADVAGARTVVIVPMLKEGELVGVITIFRQEVRPFTDKQIALVENFTQQAVIAIENTRLLNETKEALERQTATAEILKVIASSPSDVQPVFEAIAEQSNHLLNGLSTAVFSLTEDMLDLMAYTRVSPAADASLAALFPLPLSTLVFSEKIRNGEAYFIFDCEVEYAAHPAILASVRLRGWRSGLYVPLVRDSKAIGMISVTRVEPGDFSSHHVELLKTFADQAVIAIENVRLFNEVQARTRDLAESLEQQTATSEVLGVISRSVGEVEPVFQSMLANAMRICEAQCGAMLSYSGGAFRAVSCLGGAPEFEDFLREERVWGPETGMGRAERTKQPVHIVDSVNDRAYTDQDPGRLASIELGGVRTFVIVPMLKDGELIGAMSLYRRDVRAYTDKQIKLVSTFADQAVIAIENARLFREVQQRTDDLQESLQQQTATADVLKVISRSAFDLDTVMNTLAQSACTLCGSKTAALFLRDGDMLVRRGDTIEGRAGEEVMKVPVPLNDQSHMGRAILTGKIANIGDFENSNTNLRATQKILGFKAFLAVPLMRDGRGVGVFALTKMELGPFSRRQVELVQTFADQAVIAIENVRLFDEVQAKTLDLQESLQQQTATADVLKVISRSTFDLDAVLKTLTQSAVGLCRAARGAVFLRDGDVLRVRASTGNDSEFIAFLTANPVTASRKSATGRTFLTGEITHLPDVLADPEYDFGPAPEIGRFRSALTVPLLREGRVEGVFALSRPEPGSYTEREIELVQTFADQAVIAIENARLFNEVQARTADLQESLQQQTATADVLKVISRSTFDLDAVMKTLTRSAVGLCRAARGAVFLRDGDVLRVRANSGTSPEFIEFLHDNPIAPTRQTFTGRTFLTGEIIHLPDVLADPEYDFGPAPEIGQFRSALGVPLLRQGKVEGVFSLSRPEPGGFTDREIELIRTFADQAVIAIENVRLFNEVQTRTKELAASLDDLRTAQDRLVQTEKLASLGQLTAGIAHEIKNPLNFVNNFSALSAELTDELNDILKSAGLTDKTRQEVDELTGLLKDNLEKVVQHGKRADSIVKNMLLHSRAGSGEQRLADINALVDESLNLAYHGARAEKSGFNITLQRDFDANAGAAELFPQEIARALLNLISNGFYAATKRRADDAAKDFEPTLLAATKDLGGSVEIRIRDNGSGIPAEVREKMFNPFFTTKPAGEGTGLGLSMTHDIIVKQHGGSIDVATEPGQFSEFTIVLPRTSRLPNGTAGRT